ncbi:SWIM zinc finger family protein [Agrobacterium vitis]|nr:SWIM zinc finger family protein [Agrobacterium vitis]MCE6074072.1 hypothetical protein [Agrobacterium vitis]MCM2468903.1 hypothetical protein [Agrobacterium vitis]MUO72298.1 hypothetical protein [Agrobacterium vitis]MUO85032.1 hypothetical protein [Agrobacterium vitis]
MARLDLIALTDEGLIQLSNAGLVKRGLRELAAGTGPKLEEAEDGSIRARFDDGTFTCLGPSQALADASCTCPSSGLCRHRIMLALAYRNENQFASQEVQWDPGSLDSEALEASFSPSARNELANLLARPQIVRLDHWSPPTAHLPTATVRFLVPEDISYARCDCTQGQGCVHVALALRAFRQAGGQSEVTIGTIETDRATGFTASDIDTLRKSCDAVIDSLLRTGVRAGLSAHEASLESARKAASSLGAAQLLLVLNDLREQIEAYEARGARHMEQAVLRLAAELFARPRARNKAEALGLGQPLETPMGKSRLLSMGARLRQEGADIRVSIMLADSDTGATLLTEKLFSPAPSDDRLLPEMVMNRQMGTGLPVAGLGRGQVLTSVATRRADGLLRFGNGGAGRTQVMPRDSTSSFTRSLVAESVRQVAKLLGARPVSMVCPRKLGEAFFVFEIDAVLGQVWSAGRQCWEGAVQLPGEGGILHLERYFDSASPYAVSLLTAALENKWGKPRMLAGTVRLEGGTLICEPWSISADRFIVPDLETADGGNPPAPVAIKSALTMLDEMEQVLGSLLHGGNRAWEAASLMAYPLQKRAQDAGYHAMADRTGQLLKAELAEVELFSNAAVWLLTLKESQAFLIDPLPIN